MTEYEFCRQPCNVDDWIYDIHTLDIISVGLALSEDRYLSLLQNIYFWSGVTFVLLFTKPV